MSRTASASLLASALLIAGTAGAAPIVSTGGKAVLPMTGLDVVLPPQDGVMYRLSSMFRLYANDALFDGRDEIDETRDGKVIAATWVFAGGFGNGDCTTAMRHLDMAGRDSFDVEIWGQAFVAVSGRMYVGDDEGVQTVVAACTAIPAREVQLLMYRVIVGQPAITTEQAVIAALRDAVVPSAVWQAYREGRTGAVKPAHRQEVTNLGGRGPMYEHWFARSGFSVSVPGDGYIWAAAKWNTEWEVFARMAPALPRATVTFKRSEGKRCAAWFAALGPSQRKDTAINAPEGWLVGPVREAGGIAQYTLCRDTPSGALQVGLLPRTRDISFVGPLLDEIWKGAR